MMSSMMLSKPKPCKETLWVAKPTIKATVASTLIQAVHDGVLPDGVMLPVEIVVRESTRSLPANGGRR